MTLAADAAGLGLWEWDIQHRDLFWMPDRTRVMFGIEGAEKVTLESFLKRLDPLDRESARHSVEKAIQNGSDYEAEFRVELPDGAVCWMAARGKVHRNGSSKPSLMRGVSIDITRRRQAEERFRLAVEAAPNAMVMINSQGTVALVNAQAEAIFGYSREELVGQPMEMLVPEQSRVIHRDHRTNYLSNPQKRAVGAGRGSLWPTQGWPRDPDRGRA